MYRLPGHHGSPRTPTAYKDSNGEFVLVSNNIEAHSSDQITIEGINYPNNRTLTNRLEQVVITADRPNIKIEDYDEFPCIHFNFTGSPTVISFSWTPDLKSDTEVQAINLSLISNSTSALAFGSNFKMTDVPIIVPNGMLGFYLIADSKTDVFGFTNFGSGDLLTP